MKRGFNKVELLVASSLLSCLVLIAIPLITRLQSVWKSTRMYQLATLELANRMEYLTSLAPAACEKEMISIEISERMKSLLPDANLDGELVQAQGENRIILRMTLDPKIRQEPIVLVGWLPSQEGTP